MPTFRTMTVQGSRGSDFQADDIEAAAILAEQAGYEVLDMTDDIIVIAE